MNHPSLSDICNVMNSIIHIEDVSDGIPFWVLDSMVKIKLADKYKINDIPIYIKLDTDDFHLKETLGKSSSRSWSDKYLIKELNSTKIKTIKFHTLVYPIPPEIILELDIKNIIDDIKS